MLSPSRKRSHLAALGEDEPESSLSSLPPCYFWQTEAGTETQETITPQQQEDWSYGPAARRIRQNANAYFSLGCPSGLVNIDCELVPGCGDGQNPGQCEDREAGPNELSNEDGGQDHGQGKEDVDSDDGESDEDSDSDGIDSSVNDTVDGAVYGDNANGSGSGSNDDDNHHDGLPEPVDEAEYVIHPEFGFRYILRPSPTQSYSSIRDTDGKLYLSYGGIYPTGYTRVTAHPGRSWPCPLRDCRILHKMANHLGCHFTMMHGGNLLNDYQDGTLGVVKQYVPVGAGNFSDRQKYPPYVVSRNRPGPDTPPMRPPQLSARVAALVAHAAQDGQVGPGAKAKAAATTLPAAAAAAAALATSPASVVPAAQPLKPDVWPYILAMFPDLKETSTPKKGYRPILLSMPRRRDLHLLPARAGSKVFNPDGNSALLSMMVYLTGTVAPRPCNRCAERKSPYPECVIIPPDWLKTKSRLTGACASCFYQGSRRLCNFAVSGPVKSNPVGDEARDEDKERDVMDLSSVTEDEEQDDQEDDQDDQEDDQGDQDMDQDDQYDDQDDQENSQEGLKEGQEMVAAHAHSVAMLAPAPAYRSIDPLFASFRFVPSQAAAAGQQPQQHQQSQYDTLWETYEAPEKQKYADSTAELRTEPATAKAPSSMVPESDRFELEEWEADQGRAGEELDPQTVGYSALYMAKPGRVAHIGPGTQVRMMRIPPGLTRRFAGSPHVVGMVLVLVGKVRVQFEDEPADFAIGRHGMFRIDARRACLITNRRYTDALIHMTWTSPREGEAGAAVFS